MKQMATTTKYTTTTYYNTSTFKTVVFNEK